MTTEQIDAIDDMRAAERRANLCSDGQPEHHWHNEYYWAPDNEGRPYCELASFDKYMVRSTCCRCGHMTQKGTRTYRYHRWYHRFLWRNGEPSKRRSWMSRELTRADWP